MKKIFAVILGLSVYGCVLADTNVSGDISTKKGQLDEQNVATYIRGLVITGCMGAMNDDDTDGLIADAASGMDKKSESYGVVHNSIVLGSRIGSRLKKNGWGPTNDGVMINSCDDLGSYALRQPKFKRQIINNFISEPEQATIALSNTLIYRTTAKSLSNLYSENEIAADNKIGGRKIEITGPIQEIRKDFKNDVVIELQTGNQFMPVRLSMEDGERSKAAKLRKGQKTVITCDKMMLLIGSPSGNNCTIN